MKCIVDLPDSALLATHTITDLVGEISARLGIDKPDAICVPLIDAGGANYRSKKIDRNTGHWSGFDLDEVVNDVRQRIGAEIYLSVDPTMPFLDARPFVVRDQYDDDKSGVCIVNPAVQKVLISAIHEAIDLYQPSGVVLDIVDINGQDAQSGQISLTCFCSYCVEGLHQTARFPHTVMRGHPNPVNLALQDKGDGISHVPIDLQSMTALDLLAVSKARSVFNREWFPDDKDALQAAGRVLEYCEARSRVTAHAIGTIVRDIQAVGVSAAVIIDHPRFDWTSGVDLQHLAGCVDEVWTETDNLREAEVPAQLKVYHYLWGRARYTIDAYFELASNRDKLEAIAAGLTSSKSDVRRLLQERSQKVLKASELKRANVSALEAMGAFAGYIAAPITEKVMQKINDEVVRILPVADESPNTEAKDVLLLLMQLADRGMPITVDVLNQVAQRLNVFGQNE